MQGHTSYVNTATYMHDGAKVVTGSADGTVKVRGVPCRAVWLMIARLWPYDCERGCEFQLTRAQNKHLVGSWPEASVERRDALPAGKNKEKK